MRIKQSGVQYRYYETPPDTHILPLLGTGWIREYGNDLSELHFHNRLEIGYCHDGAGTLTLGERKLPYTGGMFSIIPPNYLHTTNSLIGHKCQWEYLFIDTEGFLNEIFPSNSHMCKLLIKKIHKEAVLLKCKDNLQTSELILHIMDECRTKNEFYLESIRGLTLSFLICAARICGATECDNSESSHLVAIAPAIEYIEKYYCEKIKITDLATTCHLSETHFRRLFTQIMHVSPLSYINRTRIEAVCKLLLTTDDAISDIAVKCGFITACDLNRNFKEVQGTSPSQWRKDTQYYERKLKDKKILSYEGWL
ncbi:MAG: AraC family transcriptional regulator [Oscillospiraceae bacterium]|nr:AraC family transcriptional regulator [Oscillospiraceae bacterium]